MAACAKHTVLSADQKKLIMKLHSEEKKQTEIAKLFGMNRSTVCCIIRQYERRRYWKFASKWLAQVIEWQGAGRSVH